MMMMMMMLSPRAQSLPVNPRWQTHFPSSALKLPWPEQFGRHCNDYHDDDDGDGDQDQDDQDDDGDGDDDQDDGFDFVSFYLLFIVIHLVAIGSTPSLPVTNKYLTKETNKY